MVYTLPNQFGVYMSISMPAAICMIACHANPGDHFATYAEALRNKGYNVQILAAGPALMKMQQRGIVVSHSFSLDNLDNAAQEAKAQEIAKICEAASVVLTDVGHAIDVKIQKALSEYPVKRLAYYDNPEPFVPGGYSKIACEVMQAAAGVLFANAFLALNPIFDGEGAELDLEGKSKQGIGYYPISQVMKLKERRDLEYNALRSRFFTKHGIEDHGKKLLVYFGGNNEAYFEQAFPAFLKIIAEQKDLSNHVVVIQQHPGAKRENRDGLQVAAWLNDNSQKMKMIMSDFTSDDAQVIADAALYYQTSMGAQFALLGIPTIQVGHETYEDILIRNQLAASVTTSEGFAREINALSQSKEMPSQEVIFEGLGIRKDWLVLLEEALNG